jgi:ABC-type molybdate transport system substrate-binding protein
MENTEHQFMEEMKKTSRVYILMGIKGSGKTYFINSFIQYSLKNNIHQSYYLVLPPFINEQQNSYQYLNEQKKKKIVIFNKYNSLVSQRVLKDCSKDKGRKLFIIDDSTSYLNPHKLDDDLKQILTTTRHINTDLIIATHASRSVLSVILRGNCDFLFVFKTIHTKLLEVIYEEYIKIFSQHENQKEFITEFNEKVNKQKYNCLFIDLVNSNIDFENFLKYKILTNNNTNGDINRRAKTEKKAIQQRTIPQEKGNIENTGEGEFKDYIKPKRTGIKSIIHQLSGRRR